LKRDFGEVSIAGRGWAGGTTHGLSDFRNKPPEPPEFSFSNSNPLTL
jgi:hypothetical protein